MTAVIVILLVCLFLYYIVAFATLTAGGFETKKDFLLALIPFFTAVIWTYEGIKYIIYLYKDLK